MVDIFIGEMQEDFITQLLQLIDSGRGDEAAAKLLDLDSLQNQFIALEHLVDQLGNTGLKLRFELALLSASYFNLEPIFALYRFDLLRIQVRNLAHILDLVLINNLAIISHKYIDPLIYHILKGGIASAFDLASNLKFDLELATDLDLIRNRALDHTLAIGLALDSSIGLARDLDINLELLPVLVQSIVFLLSIHYIPQNIRQQIEAAYQQTAANVYGESLYQQRENPSHLIDVIVDVVQALFGKDIRYITLEGVDHITPDILAYDIAPYLQAVGNIQKIYCELNDERFIEPRIIQIHNESPKIELIGIADIFRAINDIFSWRKRGQEANQRDLQLRKLELENELLEAKTKAQIQQITIEQNQQLDTQEKALQIAILQEEYQQKQIETQQKQAELDQIDLQKMRVYYALAEELLPRLAPDGLTLEQKTEYLPKLARYIKVMEESPLTMRIGYHDVPRPPTLPEEK